jgi:hypothetical protein
MASVRKLAFVASLVVVGLAVGSAVGMRIAAGRTAARASRSNERATGNVSLELDVPHATSELRVDGALDDAAWNEAGRTGAFTASGVASRPYSDARALWRDGVLYLALYAADEDIVSPATVHDAPLWTGDAFQLVFRRGDVEHSIDVSPRGVVTDGERIGAVPFDARWESGARVAVDRDGTMDDGSDQDEEWVVEMAIPMAALGLTGAAGERIGFEVRRCDHVRLVDAPPRRTCAAWGDARSELVLQ